MKNFLRQTTTVQKQKWFLTAFLFAALGSNYYFQVTSLNKGFIEMASEMDKDKVEVTATAAVAVKAEATAAAVPCADCIAVPKAELENLRELAKKFKVWEAEKVAAVAKAETTAEKKERIEKDKEAKKLAEKEKLKEIKLARNKEFEEKMEEAVSECAGDIECLTDNMITLLENNTGKDKIDETTVKKAFNKHIAKDLKAALKNPRTAETLLPKLGLEIPTEYRYLKDKTVDMVKNEVLSRGLEINRNFRMADSFINAKRPDLAKQYYDLGKQQSYELNHSSDIIDRRTWLALREAQDSTTLEYIKNTYAPDVNKMLSNLTSVSGLENATGVTSNTNQANASARANSRSDNPTANPLNASTQMNTQNEKTQPALQRETGVQFLKTTDKPTGSRRARE